MVGSVVSLHYSFGDYDGVIMLEAPDEKAAASMVLAAVSAGHLESIKTTTLLTVEDAMERRQLLDGVERTVDPAVLHYRLGARRADPRQLVQLLGVGGVQVHQERRRRLYPSLFEGHAVDDPGGGLGGAGGVIGAAGEDEDDEGAHHDLGPVPCGWLRLAALAGLEIFYLPRGSPKNLRTEVEPRGIEPLTSALPARRSPG